MPVFGWKALSFFSTNESLIGDVIIDANVI
jgi:hypothetical protein